MASAKLRLIESGAVHTRMRLTDFMAIIPAITGKIELVYEGEQEGAGEVAKMLINDAIETLFREYFPKIGKLEKEGVDTPYSPIIRWFENNSYFELSNDASEDAYLKNLQKLKPLVDLVDEYCPEKDDLDKAFCAEMVLWSLSNNSKLDRTASESAFKFENSILSAYFGDN